MAVGFVRCILILVGVAVATAGMLPCTAGAANLERFDDDAPAVVLPTERCGYYFMLPMQIGGDPERTLWMLIDTGASHSVIDPGSLERITGTRVKPGKWARFSLLTAGEVKFRKMRARSVEIDHLQQVLGHPFDGILGFDTFRDVLLVFDYPAGEVRIRGGTLPAADGIEFLELLGKARRPFIEMQVGAVRTSVLIDTGSGSGLTIRDDPGLVWREEPRGVSGSLRINRVEVHHTGRLEGEVRFGAVRLEAPLIQITEGTQLTGTRLLRDYVMTFDQKRRVMRLEHTGENPVRSDSLRNIGVVYTPKSDGLQIVKVFEGLPAWDAGLRQDDLVLAVDGTPVYERDIKDRGTAAGGPETDAATSPARR